MTHDQICQELAGEQPGLRVIAQYAIVECVLLLFLCGKGGEVY